MNILIVDDAVETVEVIAQCLVDTGYAVTVARGGREAEVAMQRHAFDLVITDMLMPDGDGVEVIMAARRLQPGLRTVAISGGGEFFGARDLLDVARKLGAAEILPKPFSRAQLLAAVARHVAVDRELQGAA